MMYVLVTDSVIDQEPRAIALSTDRRELEAVILDPAVRSDVVEVTDEEADTEGIVPAALRKAQL